MITLRLPPRFYEDHRSRDLPEEGVSRVIKETQRYVEVEMDRPAFDDLYSDAKHYAYSMADGGFEERGIIASAKATVRIIEAALKED